MTSSWCKLTQPVKTRSRYWRTGKHGYIGYNYRRKVAHATKHVASWPRSIAWALQDGITICTFFLGINVAFCTTAADMSYIDLLKCERVC